MAQTTIRTSEPRELLALIPFQLGFRPVESAVVVSLRGPRHRVGLVARVDLADLTGADGGALACTLTTHLAGDGATRMVLVVYTADGRDAAAAWHRVTAAAQPGLRPVECWVVTGSGYYALDCADDVCCPPGGRPLVDLESTVVGAEMVLQGAQVVGSRADLAHVPPAPVESRRSARRAAARWTARAGAAADTAELHRWRHESLVLWRSAVVASASAAAGGRSDSPTTLGRLAAGICDVLVRDAVLLLLLPGTDRVADRVLAGDGGPGVGEALRALVDPALGVAPDPAHVGPARVVLREVVAHSTTPAQAPALTLLAVLSWWEGDGARAAVLVSRALHSHPGYRLAVLLDEALAAGMPPGWLRRRQDEAAAPSPGIG